MTPTSVTSVVAAWVPIIQALLPLGVNAVSLLHGWLSAAHPTLTPDQVNAAYVAILTDDALREAFALRASTPTA